MIGARVIEGALLLTAGVSGTLETEGRKTWQLVASFTFGRILLYFRPPSATLAKIHHQPPSLQDLEPALIVTF